MNIAPLIPLAVNTLAQLSEKVAKVVNGVDNFLPNFAPAAGAASTSFAAEEQSPQTDLASLTQRLVQTLNNELHARRIASDSAATLKADPEGRVEISGGSGAEAFRFTVKPDSALARLFSAWRGLSNASPSHDFALRVSGNDVQAL